ncbi:Uncharacterized membrane protein [Alkaliphilus metalliredigens QYMF]|uniref:Uncharacterized membrane protein n=1 Tax=Alkaliphilus metalliredigens (strain QYMF) TaxID=293826 RepID=A6TKF4_ALKMQ|nr:amino acid permease [Alkaliphilus metalliredigens]ABR46672.1 Uncharacterized membrane protein [Alkaliphilus metalliredigens QYMF]
MNKKSGMPVFFALAFVWFTTHFGGGFASGAQVIQYFVKFGWFAIFTPIISQLIIAIVLYFAWKFALEKKMFDYRDWANEFYKPIQGIMSNVFEIMYNLVLVTATAVAFATGGATIEGVFGTPYLLNTVVIAMALLLLTIFGAELVRKAASIIAVIIISGVVLIYVPNVISSFGQITKNVADLRSGAIQNDTSFFSAMWSSLVYAGFQTTCIGAYIVHSNILKDKSDAKKAALWGFIINSTVLMLSTLGILAFYNDGVLTESIPALFVVRNGVGSSWMVPLISILIILGAVSTGVNLIYGISRRIVNYLGRSESPAVFKEKERTRNIGASALYVAITWSIAQFGLIPLIAKGYGTLGYISIFVIILPVIIKGIIGLKPKTKAKA